MKTCRKCKTVNGSTTSFCSRCGTRLPAGFPSFELSVPVTATETPLKAKEYIVHPLQKGDDLILPENIGKKIGTRLNPEGIKKQGEINAAPELSKPERKIPEIKTIQSESTVSTVRTEPAIRATRTGHASVNTQAESAKIPVAAAQKIPVQEPAKTYTPVAERETEKPASENSPKKLLLTPADRMLLKKQLNPGGFRGLKPEDNPFAMLKAEEIATRKQKNIEEQERKKRITEDMAYLEQLFARKGNSSAVTAKATGQSSRTPMESLLSESITVEKTLPRKSQPVTSEKNNSKKPERIAIPGNKQKETQLTQGLRHMKDNQSGERAELLSPFLTLAAFLYFCYVLYI